MYIQEFKTKTDINGNTYYLVIDHEKKTFTTSRMAADGVRITRKAMNEMIKELKTCGYRAKIYC